MRTRSGASQVRYAGNPICGYPLSIWTDGKFRLTNPRTGNIARTFGTIQEVESYRREMQPNEIAAAITANVDDYWEGRKSHDAFTAEQSRLWSAARLNPALYRRYVDLERSTGQTMMMPSKKNGRQTLEQITGISAALPA